MRKKFLTVLLVSFFSFACGYLFAGQLFPGLSLDTGVGPAGAVVADFDGDTYLDIAVVNSASGTVSILYGNGDGTFQARSDVSVGATPSGIAAGSLNSNTDSLIDFVVTNSGGSSISVLLRQAGGSYQRTDYSVGIQPVGVVVADVNGDGKSDIIVTNSGSNTVTILLGDGTGTFDTVGSLRRHDYGTGNGPRGVCVADFNADGFLDIATANMTSNTVSVFLGNGDGTFSPKTDFATGGLPYSIAAIDVGTDGIIDLVVTNSGGNSVSVLGGKGDGTFLGKIDYATGGAPLSLQVVDCNGDGSPDIITSNSTTDNVSVLLNKGDGTFNPKTDYNAGLAPSSIVSGDFDRDTKLDIAISNSGSDAEMILKGKGDGTFFERKDYVTSAVTNCGPNSLATADFNGDGRPDLVVTNSTANTFAYLAGNINGTFPSRTEYTTGALPSSIAVFDFNGDAKSDVVVANSGANSVSVFVGNGLGGFSGAGSYTAGTNPKCVVTGDFDGDGRADFAACNYIDNTVSVFYGNGTGLVAQQTLVSLTGNGPVSMAAGDFNGDGRTDFAVVNALSNTVNVFTGNSSRTFTQQADLGGVVFNAPSAILATDLNKDGILDLAVTSTGTNTLYIFLGSGDGTFFFTTPFGYATGDNPSGIYAVDINKDGNLDIVTANAGRTGFGGGNTVSVFFGNGMGGFSSGGKFGTDTAPVALVAQDFNNDGYPDIAAACVTGNSVSVLLNGFVTFLPFVISGKVSLVKGSDTDPLHDVSYVTLTMSGDASMVTQPDGAGNYSFTVSASGNYTITPSLPGYTFLPAVRTYSGVSSSQYNQNFTGVHSSVPILTVSGTIRKEDSSPVSGVQVTLSYDTGSGTEIVSQTSTNTLGYYELQGWGEPAGRTYIITPQKTGWQFVSTEFPFDSTRTVTIVSSNISGQDFTASQQHFDVTGFVGRGLTLSGISGVRVTAVSTSGVLVETYTGETSGATNYVLASVPPGTYTVSVSKSGWVFDPPQRQFTVPSDEMTGVNFAGSLILTFSSSPNGTPNPVEQGANPVQCTVTVSAVESVPITYTWTCDKGYFEDVKDTSHPRTSDLQNPVWMPDFDISPFSSSELVEIGVSASCYNGITRTGYFVEQVIPRVDIVTTGSGCFIATAAFGSGFERHVNVLRQFRDKYLMESGFGRALVWFYWKHSPAGASYISGRPGMKFIVRLMIAPVYWIVYSVMSGIALWLIVFIFANIWLWRLKRWFL